MNQFQNPHKSVGIKIIRIDPFQYPHKSVAAKIYEYQKQRSTRDGVNLRLSAYILSAFIRGVIRVYPR
jgi:hypothetical protein